MNDIQKFLGPKEQVVSMLCSRGFPHDVANEGWDNALLAASKSKDEIENQLGWLFHVANNSCISSMRKVRGRQKHEKSSTDEGGDEVLLSSRAARFNVTPAAFAAESERTARKTGALRTALERFRDDSKPRQREILLRTLTGQGPKQIASEMELTEQAVSVAKFRLIHESSLRGHLDEVDPNHSVFTRPGSDHPQTGEPSTAELLGYLILEEGVLLPAGSIAAYFQNPDDPELQDVRFFLTL